MKVAILDLIELPIEKGGGDVVSRAIIDWLSPALPEAELEVIRIAAGADFPEPDDFDGFVLSGSEKGVYDQTTWMESLRQLLLRIRDQRVPLFGICFGHQIMADTFGGKAELAGLGHVVGVRQFNIQGQTVPAHVWHQDQVTQVPPGARVLGSSDHCPVGVLAYDFPALSVQFHPEYTAEFISWSINVCDEKDLSPETARTALESVSGGNVRPDLMAADAARLFRDHKRG